MGNPPLFVGLLINGVAYAAIFIVVALLIRRFVGEFAWRAFLVLFLFRRWQTCSRFSPPISRVSSPGPTTPSMTDQA